ncbi:MAG: hypothetical protein IKZ59_03555 [Clostridia bacterium]|nr:hypothetical protein [Clostridia bacterium]
MNKRIYDLLLKKATILALSFDLYPIIPRGDLSKGFTEKVFDFDVYTVLDILQGDIINMLIARTNGEFEMAELLQIANKVCTDYEKALKSKMLDSLISNFRNEYGKLVMTHSSYMTLQPAITFILYYAFTVFKISSDLCDRQGLNFSKIILNTATLITCEKSQKSYLAIKKGGKAFALPEFKREKAVYKKLEAMIENEIASLNT